ncbi:uncharacterized protein PV09_06408 [Verruconis gallopava]|uniref:Uncharacterized protein n=1 Tax=Verruconis gallopava TaxID=253628 RepID=A0A0D1XIV8_9PEZI|nr:uncharacterized protein PV09_06408 [Verruconis gallopava]KIW02256.1 hypothetical protein PV09_06408 [Verruconis gallopava]
MLTVVFVSLFLLSKTVNCVCYQQTPAFPPPEWTGLASDLSSTFASIESKLRQVVSKEQYENTSYSVEVTSASETLWESHATARRRNETRPGVKHVDSSSQYRIASITKVFTALGILFQQRLGNVNLDDPVLNYVEELRSDEYELPWKDITLRILASQASGLPREFAQADIINSDIDPTSLGLPPASGKTAPNCDENDEYRPCNRTQLLDGLKHRGPVFAPNQRSTYSNLNFEVLGLVLADVTNMTYEQYVKTAIFEPLNMTSSSFDKPPDDRAVLPLLRNGNNYWDFEEGIQSPSGGIYSSSADMSKFVRYILTHYNALATGVNWLGPSGWSGGLHSFYGMPFEIFRTDRILPSSKRPVTFATKSGGLPGYPSRIVIMEEYGLGITVLVGGEAALLLEIVEIVTVDLVRAAEDAVWRRIASTYAGSFTAADSSVNSSLTLDSSASKGLHLKSFISNGTDVFATLFPIFVRDTSQAWYPQLTPTLLFEDEERKRGEIWRISVVHERPKDGVSKRNVWDDDCVADMDTVSYGGEPINKIIFWHEKKTLQLPAWNVTLRAPAATPNGAELVMQG